MRNMLAQGVNTGRGRLLSTAPSLCLVHIFTPMPLRKGSCTKTRCVLFPGCCSSPSTGPDVLQARRRREPQGQTYVPQWLLNACCFEGSIVLPRGTCITSTGACITVRFWSQIPTPCYSPHMLYKAKMADNLLADTLTRRLLPELSIAVHLSSDSLS